MSTFILRVELYTTPKFLYTPLLGMGLTIPIEGNYQGLILRIGGTEYYRSHYT